ncbi:MAG TPA: hypothetical protein V6C72_06600 [Chroococcales cyanobacterium]
MLTCGIEYSHIYVDERFGAEHIKSIARMKSFESSFQKRQSAIRRIILIDDYSPPVESRTLQYGEFLGQLADRGASPDVMVEESALAPYCERVIDALPEGRFRRSLLRLIESRQKYPCSLFVAAWYMLRLGAFGEPNLNCVMGSACQLQTDEILNILPDKFEKAEGLALDIIRETESHRLVELIRSDFFSDKNDSLAFAPLSLVCGRPAH